MDSSIWILLGLAYLLLSARPAPAPPEDGTADAPESPGLPVGDFGGVGGVDGEFTTPGDGGFSTPGVGPFGVPTALGPYPNIDIRPPGAPDGRRRRRGRARGIARVRTDYESPEEFTAATRAERGAARTDGEGFFIGGRALSTLGGIVSVAGAATANPLASLVGSVLRAIGGLLPPIRPAPATPPRPTTTRRGPFTDVPATGPRGAATRATTGLYRPDPREVGYETRGASFEIGPGGVGRGTVMTVSGPRTFTFDVPFPEAGF